MYRRVFAWMLAFVMVFSMLPSFAVSAQELPVEEPAASEPAVTEPKATEPKVTEPKATEPKATEPKATEPAATEPKATEPKATEPAATEPKATEPQATEPKATEPAATEPKATEPQATEPQATEPQATEPKATEPQATEPKATEPEVTEPAATEPKKSGKEKAVEKTTVTVQLAFNFPEDDRISADDIGMVDITLKKECGEELEEMASDTLSEDNGWRVTFEVEEGGTYSFDFGDMEIDGYIYDITGTRVFKVNAGETKVCDIVVTYTKDEATLIVNLAFAEDSLLSAEDVADIRFVADCDDDQHRAYLTQENGRSATLKVSSGGCDISFRDYEVDGYICTIDTGLNTDDDDMEEYDLYLSAGQTKTLNCTIRYVKNEAKLKISLPFAEDSDLTSAQVGDITVSASNSDTGDSYEAELTAANGRTVELTVTPGYYQLFFDGYFVDEYRDNLENYQSVDVTAGSETTYEQVLKYTRNEATITFTLSIAADSELKDSDLGKMKVIADDSFSSYQVEAELVSDGNGNRTATLKVVPGTYELFLDGWKQSGYVCSGTDTEKISVEAGDVQNINKTISYVKGESILRISLDVASDSLVSDEELGPIKVTVKEQPYADTEVYTLTKENGRKLELALKSSVYEVKVELPEFEGLYHQNIEDIIAVPAGSVTKLNRTICYIKNEGTANVSCTARWNDPDSSWYENFDGIDFTNVKVTFTNNDPETGISVTETLDSEGRASVKLQPGTYTATISGYDVKGYTCSVTDTQTVTIDPGERTIFFSLYYEVQPTTATISFSVEEDNELTDVNFENIAVTVLDDWESNDAKFQETKNLNSSGTAEFELNPGWYCVDFSGYEVEGYYCNIRGPEDFVLAAGEPAEAQYTIKYVKKEATLSVTLLFEPDSELNGEDFDSITAEVWPTGVSDAPVGTILLTAENGWTGKTAVPAFVDAEYAKEYTWLDNGWASESYELVFSGTEKAGYRSLFTGADYEISPMPGEEDGWVAHAKYVKAEHKVSLKVRLTEDSDMPAAELKKAVTVSLEEIANGGFVNVEATHPGSKVFSHVFDSLPASDCYRLHISCPWLETDGTLWGISLQSITCTGEVLRKDLEEGELDFALDSDCEIEVVLRAKESERSEATVIARFTEDSALQAEDFPEGITLVTTYRPSGFGPGTYEVRAGENVFSADNNWTKKITVPGLATRLKLEDQPEGYFGTVTLSGLPGDQDWIGSADDPDTVYADICFTEYQPYYLDVQIVFADDSALKGTEAGSIFLDINDSGVASSHEFKEGSWHQVLELHGSAETVVEEAFSLMLSGLARPGYTYTAAHVGDEYEFGDGLGLGNSIWEGNVAISMWDRGETLYAVFEICYTPAPGKLVVDIVSTPYGTTCDTTITVKDADGNVVAEKDASPVYVGEPDEDDPAYGEVYTGRYQCVIDLLEAGTYTISQTVEEDTDEYTYYADGDRTIEFDPVKGATVTLINERRARANLQLIKRFDKDSVLGPDDFPNGITVSLTDASGAFSGEYVLNDANGWSVDLRVPDGSYTVTETNADVEGYELETQYIFTQTFAHGSESMGGWGRSSTTTENKETTTTDSVGGPYYIFQEGWDTHKITVYNTYTGGPDDDEDTLGSITVTAGDGFYIYGGDKLPGDLGSGYEVKEYIYRVRVNEESQEITLKPGETFTLKDLMEGDEYEITPILPEDRAWNAKVETVSGKIGEEVDGEKKMDVEVSFDIEYYYDFEDSNLTILKTDALTGKALKGAKFGLYADKECTKKLATATTGKDGTCGFTITEAGTYYVKELKAPETYYVKSTEVMTVTAEEEWVKEERDGTRVLVAKMNVTVEELSAKDGAYIWENERKTTDISVTKKFAHDEDLERPDSVTIVLYQDGEAYETVKLSEENDWKYVWEDMPLGFEYTVDEVNVAKGYYKQIRSSGYDFTVINSGHWNPQTGDDSMIALWISTATLSLVALAVLNEKKRRQRA